MELEYGKWCTVRGTRYMIVDWTRNHVKVNTANGSRLFHRSVVEQVTDFYDPAR